MTHKLALLFFSLVCFGSFNNVLAAAKGKQGDSCETSFDCFGPLTCYKQICSTFEEAEKRKASTKKTAAGKTHSDTNQCYNTTECPIGSACSAGKCKSLAKSELPKEPEKKPVEDHTFARFRAPYNGNFILLWVSPQANADCGDWGNGYAEEIADILGKTRTIRWLCYRVNEKKKLVEFKDPEKRFFNNTFAITSQAFEQLKWPSEREAEHMEAEHRATLDAIARARENLARQPEPTYFPPPRMPITCIHMGDITTCN